MIPVRRVREPRGFDADVRKRGKRWLRENPDAKRPKPYWQPYTGKLAEGFANRCGYAAMYVPTGSVDHYLSAKNHPALTYEWGNYRFADAAVNARKKTADAAVLDPYEVGEGWFEIILPSLQMRVTDRVPSKLRAKAEYTLKRLKLVDGEQIIRWRKSWHEMYCAGRLTLEGLKQVAPLLAAAVEKQA